MSFCKKKMEKHYEKKEICFGVKIEKKYSNYLVENNFIMFKNQKIGYILQEEKDFILVRNNNCNVLKNRTEKCCDKCKSIKRKINYLKNKIDKTLELNLNLEKFNMDYLYYKTKAFNNNINLLKLENEILIKKNQHLCNYFKNIQNLNIEDKKLFDLFISVIEKKKMNNFFKTFLLDSLENLLKFKNNNNYFV
jgi:hypothetical protein